MNRTDRILLEAAYSKVLNESPELEIVHRPWEKRPYHVVGDHGQTYQSFDSEEEAEQFINRSVSLDDIKNVQYTDIVMYADNARGTVLKVAHNPNTHRVFSVVGLPEGLEADLEVINKYYKLWKDDPHLAREENGLLKRVLATGLYEPNSQEGGEDAHIDRAYEDRYGDF